MTGKKSHWYVSYYRRFIPNFLAIVKPLIKLTKKFAKFEWSKEYQAAFDFFKESLKAVPVLAYPDSSKPCILYTDASDDCLGHVFAKNRIHKGR